MMGDILLVVGFIAAFIAAFVGMVYVHDLHMEPRTRSLHEAHNRLHEVTQRAGLDVCPEFGCPADKRFPVERSGWWPL